MSGGGLVVFDFDGTLADSAGVKTEAFHLLYLDEHGPEVAARVLAYHLEHQGISRYDKIRFAEEEILGRPCTEARLDEVADRFSHLVEDRVVAAAAIPGAEEFLASNHGRRLSVASATPTAELRRIVARRGWNSHFAAVDGSPMAKGEIIELHMAQLSIARARTVMVGDQMSDHRAAEHAGVRFIGVRSDPDVSFPAGTEVIADLTGLDGLLE